MCLFVWHHQHKICSQLGKACKNSCRTFFILHCKLIWFILGFALNWSFYLVLEDCTSVYRGRWCSCCSDLSIWKFPLLSSSNDVGAFKIEWFGDGKTAIFPNCLLLSFPKNCELFDEVPCERWANPGAGYLAVAGLNLLAQISDRISPFGVVKPNARRLKHL